MERTLCLLKPDAVRRGLIGEILSRIERNGLKIIAMKMMQANKELACQHYTYEDIALRHGEEVYQQLTDFLSTSALVALIVEGDSAINVLRKICGSTEPATAPVGTIRGDYAHQSFSYAKKHKKAIANLIHASANPKDAQREIKVWFADQEIYGQS